MATALSIIQDATGRLGLAQPGVAFTSSDRQVIQLRTLLNQEGKELTRAANWTRLQTEWDFTTVATSIQTSALASDFDHIINDTMWDRTTDRPVYGPLNAQEWQREKAGPTFTSVYYAFRIRGEDLLITPTPSAGDSIFYEYISKHWAEDSGGTGIDAFTADTDVPRLDSEAITLGLVWRFRAAKKLDYQEEKAAYDAYVEQLTGRDGGKPLLNISFPMPYRRFWPNVPEGSWPSS